MKYIHDEDEPVGFTLAALREGRPMPVIAVGLTVLHSLQSRYDGDALESVRALVAAGADVNTRSVGGSGSTPLHYAASRGDGPMTEVLLECGADAHARNAAGEKPLDIYSGQYDFGTSAHQAIRRHIAQRLEERLAAAWSDNADGAGRALMKLPLDLIADPEIGAQLALASTALEALEIAVLDDNLDAAIALANAGADLRGAEREGAPLMLTAAINGNTDLIRLLLDLGADADAPVRNDQTVEQNLRAWGCDEPADAIAAWRAQELEKRLADAWSDNAELREQRDALKDALSDVLDQATALAPSITRARL